MAKFVIALFAALAFQVALAQPYQYQNHQLHGSNVQDLLPEIQSVGRAASSGIQNVDISQHGHVLYSQANEFAHYIHEIAYHLQHLVHHGEEGHTQELLEHAVRTLSEVVHSIHNAIHHDPSELKSEFVVQIQHVVAEAQKLAQVVQQEQSDSHHEEIQEALDDILAAVQELQVRNHIESGGQPEIRSFIQTLTNQVVGSIHGVTADREDVVEQLVHHAHHYGHHLGDIVHKLQKGVRSHDIHDEQVRSVLQQVSSNLGQIHSSLQQVEVQSRGQIGHLPQDYGRIGGSLGHIDHHPQDFGRIGGSLGHVEHHSQDYSPIGSSLGHLDHHSQVYSPIGGSLGHVEHHSLDSGRIGGSVGHVGYHAHQGFGPVEGSLEHQYQKTFGQIGGSYDQLGQHYPGGYGSFHAQIRQVIQVLESSVRGVAVQLQRLVQLTHSTSIKEHGHHNVTELVHTVIAHSLVATRQLERQIEYTVHHGNNVNHVNYVDQETY